MTGNLCDAAWLKPHHTRAQECLSLSDVVEERAHVLNRAFTNATAAAALARTARQVKWKITVQRQPASTHTYVFS